MELHIREDSGLRLADLVEETATNFRDANSMNAQIRVDVGAMAIRFVDSAEHHEVPLTVNGVSRIADWMSVPTSFLLRQEPDLQEHILNTRLERTPGFATVVWDDTGVQGVVNPESHRFEPKHIVEIATRIFGPTFPVVERRDGTDAYGFDVVVPDGFDSGTGGDLKVGDVTKGGLRFSMKKTAANRTPEVRPFLYRLVCTNGMEMPEAGAAIDGRGAQTVDEVLDEIERQARIAFGSVEESIRHFYDLRTKKVENPERVLNRIASEHGIAARTLTEMSLSAPDYPTDEWSMFDIANFITNQANAANLRDNPAGRRRLERVGGSIIAEHAIRCAHCEARLVR